MYCHAFTLAVDRICNGGGEAFVRTDGCGNVFHSVYRLPNTTTFVDEMGEVTLDSVPGLFWESVPLDIIRSMATKKDMRREAKAVLAGIDRRR